MESWSYASEGRGLLFSEEEVDLTMDALARNREVLMGWDITSSCDSENGALVSDREAVETMEFMELGLLDMMIKPLPSNPSKIHLGGEIGDDLCQSVVSPACMIASSSFLVEEESGSRVSNSLMESNSSDSSLIDLKLGRLPDCGDAKNGKLLSEKSMPAKRARATNLYLQTPYCQVHGCNKDLSSSKDYHKRHKVCDLHSKTAKVVVNGIEQRFCQQCSRFHLLGEFDDGKRSCRRRLAGHNERRRKIQFDSYPSRHQNLLQSYQGARFQGTSSPTGKASVWSEVFPGGVLYTDRYELANSCKRMKSEREPTYNSQLATPITSHLFRESILPLHCVGRERLSGIYQSGSEDYSPFNTASNIHELSHLSNSGCALSLLSAHSQDLSSHWAGILLASPMTTQGSHCDYSAGQNPNKSLGISSLENFIPCGSHSSGMNLIEVGQTQPVMLSDVSDAVEFGVHSDGNLGNFQRSDSLSTKNCLPHERECTVDLLQLSSHLQRVEQQRNYMQVKQENQGFCYFPTI